MPAVVVETGAGKGAGINDDEYVAAGAEIITSADQIFARCDLIMKVKEPLDLERKCGCGVAKSSSPISTWLLVLNRPVI